MKMLELKTEAGFVRFALDSVLSYGIVYHKKAPRKPDHYLFRVMLKPIKQLDKDFLGNVVEYCEELEIQFDTIEQAESAMTIIEL